MKSGIYCTCSMTIAKRTTLVPQLCTFSMKTRLLSRRHYAENGLRGILSMTVQTLRIAERF